MGYSWWNTDKSIHQRLKHTHTQLAANCKHSTNKQEPLCDCDSFFVYFFARKIHSAPCLESARMDWWREFGECLVGLSEVSYSIFCLFSWIFPEQLVVNTLSLLFCFLRESWRENTKIVKKVGEVLCLKLVLWAFFYWSEDDGDGDFSIESWQQVSQWLIRGPCLLVELK